MGQRATAGASPHSPCPRVSSIGKMILNVTHGVVLLTLPVEGLTIKPPLRFLELSAAQNRLSSPQ